MKAALSQSYAESLKKGDKDQFHWDTALKGFGLKITPAGSVTWVLQRRIEGSTKERRITIGSFPAMRFDAARTKASELIRQVEEGHDPVVVAAKAQRETMTVVELLRAYVEKNGTKESYKVNIRRTIDNHIAKAPFADWRATDLDSPTVRKWLETYAGATGTAANILQHLRGAYNYGRAFGLIPQGTENPAAALGRQLSFKLRKNTCAMAMEEKELGDLLRAIDEAYSDRDFNPIAVAMIEMILHTGARKSEILSLRFDELDVEARTITKQDHKTVNQTGKPRIIRLSKQAMEVLDRAASARKQMRRENDTWVFPAYRGGGHMADANRPVTQIGEKCGFPTLKPHNLRSLYINLGLDSHVPLPVVAANVGHANVDTTLAHYVKNRKSALMAGADTVGIKLAQLSKLAND